MSRNGQEILYEGWLTKSPPTKRIFRGRWRRRWFTLHPGEMPDQYILSYYADRKSRKLKGSINLDQCEQVDKGFKFEDKKFKFDFMFDIKTPTRTYYLAADTELEMKSWVQCICRFCGLTGTDEDELEGQEDIVDEKPPASPNASPISTSPYILVSECFTGKTPVLPNQNIQDINSLLQHNMKSYYGKPKGHINDTYDVMQPTYLNFDPKSYDIPRNLNPSHTAGLSRSQEEINYFNFDKKTFGSPLQSPTDTESVFTDDDWSNNLTQSEHSIKYSRPSNSSTEFRDMVKKTIELCIDKTAAAPPRPPKPSHIVSPSACYHNLQTNKTMKSDGTKSGNHSKSNSTSEDHQNFISDEMYDFPRSHNVEADIRSSLSRRHCYNNAAPGTIFTYDSSPKPSTSSAHIFRYGDEILGEPASPMSQDSSSTAQYSNLPSPILPDTQLMPPPKVNRGLKPKRKLSDSHSISSNTEPASPQLAPSVDRKLKPPILRSGTMPTSSRRRESDDDNTSRKYRAAPSPTPPSLGRSYESLLVDNEQIYHSFPDLAANKKKILEYLDLDLESKSNNARHSRNSNDEPLRSPGANTVYKKVDFMKTEAFNNTRNDLEKERNKTVPLLKK